MILNPKLQFDLLTAGVAIMIMCSAIPCRAEQVKLTMRDLSVIESAKIEFDEEQITLANGKHFGWDQVLTADLTSGEKKRFKTLVQNKGLPLFRIRHRLEIGDWSALGEIAEPMYRKIEKEHTTESNARRHFLLHLALFRSRLQSGNRTGALTALLKLLEIKTSYPEMVKRLSSLTDAKSILDESIFDHLLPVWFDAKAAGQLAEELVNASSQSSNQMSDVKLIYFTSIFIASNKLQSASEHLESLNGRKSNLARKWHPLLATYLEFRSGKTGPFTARLENSLTELDSNARAVANYLVAAQYSSAKNNSDHAVLKLLYIPANYSAQYPALSTSAQKLAAEISEKSGRQNEAKIIRSELSKRSGKTYHDGLRNHN